MNVPDEHRKGIADLNSFKQYCLLKRENNICYEGMPTEKPTTRFATGYNQSKWITYLEEIDDVAVLPDSVVNHIDNEGMVLCFQDLK